MSLPQRLSAYIDCVEIFDKAPIRVEFADFSEAKLFQMRMHQCRLLLSNQSKRMYQPDDPQWGQTGYDYLICRNPVEDAANHWWVYIESASSTILSMEPLSGEAESTDAA